MKNLITAVKKFVKALGAEDNDSNNLVDVIDKAADSVSGGSGGSDLIIVTVSSTNGTTGTSDITYEELFGYISNKKPIIFQEVLSSGKIRYSSNIEYNNNTIQGDPISVIFYTAKLNTPQRLNVDTYTFTNDSNISVVSKYCNFAS